MGSAPAPDLGGLLGAALEDDLEDGVGPRGVLVCMAP